MKKPLISIICVFIFAACSENKTAESVIYDKPNNRYGSQSCYGQAIPNQYIVRWENGQTSVVKANSREQLVKNFIKPNLVDIKFIEEDREIKFSPAIEEDLNQSQYGEPANWGADRIMAQTAWSKSIKGQGVIVAVVDSGVDLRHPQLEGQIYKNTAEIPNNGIDDDGNGYIDDVQGYDFYRNTHEVIPMNAHGTHVSGIILAEHSPNSIHGVAPQAKLIPLNFMSQNGGGSLGDAIRAIEYAAQQGAKVINASWGGAPCTEALASTIAALEARNVLIVVASGNSSLDIDRYPEYPAAYNLPAQITVGASTYSERMAGFSNYGFDLVHLMAPGANILSTVPNAAVKEESGTSMAAPFVSGAAALLWSYRPSANVIQIKQALVRSVDVGGFPVATRGRLNIEKAIAEIEKLVP